MPDKIRMRRGNIANLPTLDDGEFGLAEDTKKLYIGTTTGNQGIVSAAPFPQAWISPTLLNAWLNFGGAYALAGYFIDDLKMVHIRGFIRSGTAAAGTALFVLPVGYRPLSTLAYPTLSSNAGAALSSTIDVYADGGVAIGVFPVGATWLSINLPPFRAEQ